MPASSKHALSSIVFGAILFLSAFLVFYSEPMIGKMVLPFLGGAPAVWTTCVLFFQAMLLAGYAYAHVIERLFSLRVQLIGHLVLMSAAIPLLPIGFSPASSEEAATQPVAWLLGSLFLSAALPFGVVVSSAPLLQNWLSKTGAAAGRDPYFLYAFSNAGSFLALLVYPVLVEPRLGLIRQSEAWFVGYALLFAAIVGAARFAWTHRTGRKPQPDAGDRPDNPPTIRKRAFWLAASFVPSALMLAVTNHISANLVAAPFLWVIPLAVYLLTFILAFSRSRRISLPRVSLIVPVIFLLSPYVTTGAPIPALLIWIVFPAHIAILFFGSLLCHSALAEDRPSPQYLTEFYLYVAVGGVLAGVFSAIVAPSVFGTVFEYPLLVATLGFFRARPDSGDELKRNDIASLVLVASILTVQALVFRFAESADAKEAAVGLLTNGAFVLIYSFRSRRMRFAWALAIFVIGSAMILPGFLESGTRLYAARDFFGVKKVVQHEADRTRRLLHGDTIHGVESLEPDMAGVPLSYFHPAGPAGEVMEMMDSRGPQNVGVIGLGAGSLAAYASQDRQITFFELDPQIVEIAQEYFTFLDRCGTRCTTVVADGRLALLQQPDGAFDLLIVDAFSSDSIPAHLVSLEAMALYFSKLKPEGVLLFHVSNRYLDVESLVVGAATESGLQAYVRRDNDDESVPGKSSSNYVAAVRREDDFGALASNPLWMRLSSAPVPPWTDDYSNILNIFLRR